MARTKAGRIEVEGRVVQCVSSGGDAHALRIEGEKLVVDATVAGEQAAKFAAGAKVQVTVEVSAPAETAAAAA